MHAATYDRVVQFLILEVQQIIKFFQKRGLFSHPKNSTNYQGFMTVATRCRGTSLPPSSEDMNSYRREKGCRCVLGTKSGLDFVTIQRA